MTTMMKIDPEIEYNFYLRKVFGFYELRRKIKHYDAWLWKYIVVGGTKETFYDSSLVVGQEYGGLYMPDKNAEFISDEEATLVMLTKQYKGIPVF